MKEQLLVLLDVIIAFVLAGIVGFERETVGKPAGFRTNMIIAGASTLMLSVARLLVDSYQDLNVRTAIDPVRVIEAVVVGISFIGAGTIWKSETSKKVENLTTASTILFSAGIGMTVAMKLYILSVGLVILVLLVNTVLRKFQKVVLNKKSDESPPDVEKNP